MKRTALALTLIFALFIPLMIGAQPANSASKTIVVPDDYPTIEYALTTAVDGDTIFVKKGTYVENPVINKSVSLIGEERDETVIDVTAGLKVETDNVTITGLTIYDGWQGIAVSADYCNISGNRITNSQYGIILLNAENNSITGNVFQSIGPAAAIQLSYSNSNSLRNNYVDSCTEGIQLREGSSCNLVTENTVTNCEYVALRLLGSGVGARWYDPKGNKIMGNNMSNSGYGTTVYGSNENIITNNNYVNNSVQFSANEEYLLIWGGNVSVNTIEKNYWSDYAGTDANGDGIGDTPYIIDENNADHHPLMKAATFQELPDGQGNNGTNNGTNGADPFPALLIVAVAVTVAGVVVAMALVYSKKRIKS